MFSSPGTSRTFSCPVVEFLMHTLHTLNESLPTIRLSSFHHGIVPCQLQRGSSEMAWRNSPDGGYVISRQLIGSVNVLIPCPFCRPPVGRRWLELSKCVTSAPANRRNGCSTSRLFSKEDCDKSYTIPCKDTQQSSRELWEATCVWSFSHFPAERYRGGCRTSLGVK